MLYAEEFSTNTNKTDVMTSLSILKLDFFFLLDMLQFRRREMGGKCNFWSIRQTSPLAKWREICGGHQGHGMLGLRHAAADFCQCKFLRKKWYFERWCAKFRKL